ncbi:hypothetical protein TWF694_009462 [Orbilia ellipsospora]|uniref:Uncharacterized protein n=1 Tax=Orbilia ellipsospora TaxID=2528407 RepID=A0AAV9XB77_9PEZI
MCLPFRRRPEYRPELAVSHNGVPPPHYPAKGILSGPRFERKYQKDLAAYGPEIAEQRHRERRRKSRNAAIVASTAGAC